MTRNAIYAKYIKESYIKNVQHTGRSEKAAMLRKLTQIIVIDLKYINFLLPSILSRTNRILHNENQYLLIDKNRPIPKILSKEFNLLKLRSFNF